MIDTLSILLARALPLLPPLSLPRSLAPNLRYTVELQPSSMVSLCLHRYMQQMLVQFSGAYGLSELIWIVCLFMCQ